MYLVKSKTIDSPIAPPDIHVPAQRAVIESSGCFSLFSFTHFTKFCTSSLSLGKITNFGRISKILASCEYFESISSLSSTSPFIIFCISSFKF